MSKYLGTAIAERYLVQEKLGQGAYGEVLKCWDIKLARVCALKVLLDTAVGQAKQRFHIEAQVAARLNHPNILPVRDFGYTDDDSLYLVMDYLQGETLQAVLSRKGRLDVLQVLSIISGICSALKHAHSFDILHRDIKPANVMLCFDEKSVEPKVMLVDFGIAKRLDSDQYLTATGKIVGTVAYMSPESIRMGPVDTRSDLYSLGCLAFELLTGDVPFDNDNPMELMLMHVNAEPPTLSQTVGLEFPQSVEAFVARFLKKDPDERYQSAEQVEQAIANLLKENETRAWTAYTAVFQPSSSSGGDDKAPLLMAGMILAVIALGGSLAFLTVPQRKSYHQARALESADFTRLAFHGGWGAKLTLEGSGEDQSVKGQRCGEAEFKEAAEKFKGVKHWYFVSSTDNGSGLKYLADEPVESLALPSAPLDSEGIKSIALFKGLQILDLTSCNLLKDDDLSVLTELPELEQITVSGSLLTGSMCKYLAQVPTLTNIGILVELTPKPPPETDLVNLLKDTPDEESHVDDNSSGKNKDNRQSNLRYERLSVSADDINELSKLDYLSRITFVNVELNTDSCKALSRLENLQTLKLLRCTIGDGGAVLVGNSKSIKKLDLRGSAVPIREINSLRKNAGLRVIN